MLFGVTGSRSRSGLSDDQAVSGGSDNFLGDKLNLIDLEDALDLGQEAGQQPEVSPTHSDQRDTG